MPTVPAGSPRMCASERLREKPISTGRPSADQLGQPADELEVVLVRLPEADSRVEADELLADPLGDRERQPLLEEGLDLRDDVVVARVGLHRPRLALHVHQAAVRARLGDDACELRIAAQRGDVVDQLRAELERLPRDLGLRGVDRDRLPLRALRAPAGPAAAPRRQARPPSRAGSTRRRRRRSPRPASSMPSASAVAASRRRCTPPSENESGVTLITPITEGAGSAPRKDVLR